MHRYLPLLAVLLCCFSCDEEQLGSLCERTFEPYPDIVSNQAPTSRNATLLAGMAKYNAQDYVGAAADLELYVGEHHETRSAHLYLACCYLATGKPFDAELSLDRLETSNVREFKDQCEWYTVVCWLCSDQPARALEGARSIANMQRHTYKVEAAALADLLQAASKP